jgi:hypothetical protein
VKEQHALAEKNGRTVHPLPKLAMLSQAEDDEAPGDEVSDMGDPDISEASEDDILTQPKVEKLANCSKGVETNIEIRKGF